MANPEHLAVLKQGVKVWNDWVTVPYRGRPSGTRKPDLNGLDGAFLRKFNWERFMEEYCPAPSEIAELHEMYVAGTLSVELQRYGYENLNDINLNHADLRGTDLSDIYMERANLIRAQLSNAKLIGAGLASANLYEADLMGSQLTKIDLSRADLTGCNLSQAELTGAILSGANLTGCNLTGADLTGAILSGANLTKGTLRGASLRNVDLEKAILVETILDATDLSGCQIYGLSAWNLNIKGVIQSDLIITPKEEPIITVDNLEVAQFMYLLLNNGSIRDVIDTVTSKVVLILGRFSKERKAVLDALRDHLRKRNYLPVLFDFEKPASRDITETVRTLAGMSRFVIADITDAKSIPQELMAIVPNLPSVPVQPLLLSGQQEYGMFEHFRRYPWVLPIYLYDNQEALLRSIDTAVIAPAMKKAKELPSRGE
jgi:hypothetical protein